MNPDPTLLSIAVLAAFALVGGGVFRFVKRGERTQGGLMVVAALVLLGNILLWALPV
jgi:hypothetical protein